MTAKIGALDIENEKSYNFKIEKFVWSGIYKTSTLDYDIALLHTKTDIYNSTFKELNATLLISDYNNKNVAPNFDYVVYGWGKTKTDGQSSNRLLKTDLIVLEQNTCMKYWGNSLTDRMLCASEQNHASCQVNDQL